ncbi:MAG: hypothetical protein Q8P27_01965 [Candidatus Peregrinibacteria bacterium]|nr:hypothetical protein [Candidatus Peregrinibacteria bacterium]
MQRFLRTIFVVLFLCIPLAVFLMWYFLVGFHSDAPGNTFNKDKNGIWLDHSWVDTDYPLEAIQTLGEELIDHDIRYVYLHTGPFESDGTISPDKYPQAQFFLQEMHSQFPELEWYAWIGQLRSRVDLDDEQVRNEMLATVQTLVETIGFDGIHYNIEPVRPTEDEGFLNLLFETRLALFETPISLATDEWQPEGLTGWAEDYFNIEIVSYWSTQDFEAVIPYVDQVVVMGYDTSLTKEDWYLWFLEQQVIYVTKAVEGSEVELLIGIPSYNSRENSETFDEKTENVKNGLLGVIQGLTNGRTVHDNFAGVAIYAYWETDSEEWRVYQELWQD